VISPKFFSQIFTCKSCKGWGFLDSPPEKSVDVCKECDGKGVFLSQSEDVYVWDAPTFVNYKARIKLFIAKLFALIVVIASVIFIFILGKNIILQVAKYFK
jgi:hypothetical protein